MKSKKAKNYILYKYDKYINDIIYIKEYNNIKDLQKDFDTKNIYQYISESVEDVKKILKDKYVIIKEVEKQ